jgi:hypothetical protein
MCVQVVSVLAGQIVPNLRAADIVSISGPTTGKDRFAILATRI